MITAADVLFVHVNDNHVRAAERTGGLRLHGLAYCWRRTRGR
ncbi:MULTISPECIES: hypothetical protein [unclassified Streptomyces]